MPDPGGLAVGLVAAVVGLLAVGLAVRWLAGPVFAYELTVLARRGYQTRLRVGLVAVLLVVLLFTYVGFYGWDAVGGRTPTIDPRSGQFAERFAVTTLAVQLIAVIVLTPAVVGAAVTEERDRGTLDLLRTTALTDREIVIGKLLARLAVVGGVAAAGLPVLALTLLFGGVDPDKLFRLYAVTAGAAFGLGALSVYLGTVAAGLRTVLARVYLLVVGITLLGGCAWSFPAVGGVSPVSLGVIELVREVWPFSWTPGVRYMWANYVVFGVLYGGGGLLYLRWAVRAVRASAVRRTDEPFVEPGSRRRFYVQHLTDDADPLVWQERQFGDRRFGSPLAFSACNWFVLFVFGAGLFVGLARAVEQAAWIGGAVGQTVRPMLAAAAVLLPLAVGVRLAGAVAGERERQTLDALRMLPGDRRDILWAKLMAALGWVGWGILLLAGSLTLAVLVGGIGVVSGLLAGMMLAGFTAAAIGLSGWLTVRERTGARATVLFLIALLVVTVGPLVLLPVAKLFGVAEAVVLACPPAAVWTASPAGLLPAAVYGLVGWGLWRLAERRMDGDRGSADPDAGRRG